ncbi:fanconi anemia group F protein-like [Elysia marginata]|uniref:Fanconi anemia group F protein-like n=1 Tax=Elysia marginata TaxID=1093978 RepID=A0AAV4I1J9_9GAST|nr:fanconi anemia group F protein-like [Elysia marginata]
MSLHGATVLRNVFQFATILNQASNSDVQKWDDVSLLNALDWADYCQELYVRLKDKPFENELNSHLAQMSMLLQPVSCLFLTLDSLQNAKYLLVNSESGYRSPHRSIFTLSAGHGQDQARQAAIPSKLSLVSFDQRREACQEETQLHHDVSTLRAATDLHTGLSSRSAQGPDKTRRDRQRFQANFLLRHLMNVVRLAKKKHRFESYCHAVCDKLMQSPDGNNIFVFMLGEPRDDVERHIDGVERQRDDVERQRDDVERQRDGVERHIDGVERHIDGVERQRDGVERQRDRWLHTVQDHLLSWLQLGIQQDFFHCPLLKADVRDVTGAAAAHPRVFSVYLDVLCAWTDSCIPEIQAPDCLVWRSPNGADSLELTRHFQHLLSSLSSSADHSRRHQVVRLIADRTQCGQFTAWRDVATKLLHLLKHG